MTRLDVWLVERGFFASRQIAKRAIKSGLVRVEGMTCKPSKEITGTESIDILDELADNPMGFQKLRAIDRELNDQLVQLPCSALDIGSSAGGFLLYLASKDVQAIGVEVSPRFLQNLEEVVSEHNNISVIVADAFELNPLEIAAEGTLDLLLIDVTTDYYGSIQLVSRYSRVLKSKGRLVLAIKAAPDDDNIHRVRKDLESLAYQEIRLIVLNESRQEFHVTGIYS